MDGTHPANRDKRVLLILTLNFWKKNVFDAWEKRYDRNSFTYMRFKQDFTQILIVHLQLSNVILLTIFEH